MECQQQSNNRNGDLFAVANGTELAFKGDLLRFYLIECQENKIYLTSHMLDLTFPTYNLHA